MLRLASLQWELVGTEEAEWAARDRFYQATASRPTSPCCSPSVLSSDSFHTELSTLSSAPVSEQQLASSRRHAQPDTCSARVSMHVSLVAPRSARHVLCPTRRARPTRPGAHRARPDTRHTRVDMLSPTRATLGAPRSAHGPLLAPRSARHTQLAPRSARHAPHQTRHARPDTHLVAPCSAHGTSSHHAQPVTCHARGAMLGPTRTTLDVPCSAHGPRGSARVAWPG